MGRELFLNNVKKCIIEALEARGISEEEKQEIIKDLELNKNYSIND